MRDLNQQLQVVDAIVPAVYSADQNGSDIDLQNALGCMIAFQGGAEGDTLSGSDKIDVYLEASEDDGAGSPAGYAAITDAHDYSIGSTAMANAATGLWKTFDANSELPFTGQIGVIRGLTPNLRWVRLRLDFSGTHSTGTPFAATAILLPGQAPAV